MATITNKRRGYEDKLGFSYHSKGSYTNRSNITVKRYACNNDKKDHRGLGCDGTCDVNVFPDGTEEEVLKNDHNEACHARLQKNINNNKKETELLRRQFMDKVKAEATSKGTKATYNAFMAETNLNLGKKLPFKRVERHARRVKSNIKKQTITLPNVTGVQTIEELGSAFLEAEEAGKPFSFKIGDDTYPVKTVILNGKEKEGYTIMWFVESHAQQFKNAKLSMDATYQFCPKLKKRKKHQFFSIMADQRGGPLPIAFCLMTRKTKSAYKKIFKQLDSRFPNLKPKVIMADFEKAPRNAARSVWRKVKLLGCFFHSAQNIEKHAKKKGVFRQRVQKTKEDPVRYKLKRKAQSLALLRPQDMDEGMSILFAEGEALHDQQVMTWLRYVNKTWVAKKEVFSVFGESQRTNNAMESAHSTINEIGQGPAIPVFCEVMLGRFREAIIKYAQIDNIVEDLEREGKSTESAYFLVCEKKTSQRKYDEALKEAWKKLEQGTWDVNLFLNKMSTVSSRNFPMSVSEFLTVQTESSDEEADDGSVSADDMSEQQDRSSDSATEEVEEATSPTAAHKRKRQALTLTSSRKSSQGKGKNAGHEPFGTYQMERVGGEDEGALKFKIVRI